MLLTGVYLEKWLQVIDKKLSVEGTSEPHEVMTACDLLVWISKATVMRGHRSQQQYVQKVYLVNLVASHLDNFHHL